MREGTSFPRLCCSTHICTFPDNTKLICLPSWTSSLRKWYNFPTCEFDCYRCLPCSCLGRNDGWKAFLLDFSSSVEYLTGQPIDIKVSPQNTATEEELETLRCRVGELIDAVGHLGCCPYLVLT